MASPAKIHPKDLTLQLTKASADIGRAAQNLENVFQKFNSDSEQNRASTTTAPPVPDPIKLIKRMTALEIALSSLQDECKTVAAKRTQAVQRVIESQCDTVRAVKDLLNRTDNDDPYSSRDEILDESWETLTRSLEKQYKLGQAS